MSQILSETQTHFVLCIRKVVQQDNWVQANSEESLGHLTMLAAEPVLRRIWDTPEEDAAWNYLEDREHGTV